MSISGNPEQHPRRKCIVPWEYHEVPCKTSCVGWLAGQPTWVICHHLGTSKPCKRAITSSALVCPFCESGMPDAWRGFTPFYDQDYARRFVLLPEDQRERMSEIGHLAQIRISRGKNPKEGLVCRPENWRVTPLPDRSERAFKIDLTAFLLHILWKDQELIQWYAAETTRKAKAAAKEIEIPSLKDDPALKNLAARKAKLKEREQLLADSLPSLNGHAENGKKPKPP